MDVEKERRIDQINKLLVEMATGNFNYRSPISERADEYDAIITGINMLGEELQATTVSKDYLNSIYTAVVDMLIILNPDKTIQSVNDAVFEQLYFESSELVNKPFEVIFANNEVQYFQGFEELEKNGSVRNIEKKFKAKNGKVIPVSCSYSFLYDNNRNISGILCIAKDISSQIQIQEELKKSKQLFELAIRASNDGIWEYDYFSQEIYFSPRYKEMLGYAEDFPNSLTGLMEKIHPDERAENLQFIKEFSESEDKTKEFRRMIRFIHKDGSIVFVLSKAIKHYDENGKLLRIVGSNTDITSQKIGENLLIEAKNQAESASKAKSTFLANMSHEIRTPLNGILGFAEFLLKTPLTSTQAEYLKLIHTSGQTLSKLLSDILDLNKIEEGKLTIESSSFNFIDVINTGLAPYKYMANDKGLNFNIHFDDSITKGNVIGDSTRIKQILINLISNSLKFTSEGGIDVGFSVLESSEKSDTMLVQGHVRDTGIGIPKDKQQIVFESFTQSDNSITRKFGGSGLGLTIVKELVNLMGGTVNIESPSSQKGPEAVHPGTSFFFTFKLLLDTATPIAKKEVPVATPKQYFSTAFKILIVEDNEINQMLAESILEKLGLAVVVVENGELAVEKVKQEDFDAILMDIQMPVMDGYEATRQIRKNNFVKPIIALSANVYKEDIEKAIESGMNSHVGKPFTISDVYNELKKWLIDIPEQIKTG